MEFFQEAVLSTLPVFQEAMISKKDMDAQFKTQTSQFQEFIATTFTDQLKRVSEENVIKVKPAAPTTEEIVFEDVTSRGEFAVETEYLEMQADQHEKEPAELTTCRCEPHWDLRAVCESNCPQKNSIEQFNRCPVMLSTLASQQENDYDLYKLLFRNDELTLATLETLQEALLEIPGVRETTAEEQEKMLTWINEDRDIDGYHSAGSISEGSAEVKSGSSDDDEPCVVDQVENLLDNLLERAEKTGAAEKIQKEMEAAEPEPDTAYVAEAKLRYEYIQQCEAGSVPVTEENIRKYAVVLTKHASSLSMKLSGVKVDAQKMTKCYSTIYNAVLEESEKDKSADFGAILEQLNEIIAPLLLKECVPGSVIRKAAAEPEPDTADKGSDTTTCIRCAKCFVKMEIGIKHGNFV